MELILAAAFKAVMGGVPAVPLFKRFQTGWDSINQGRFHDSTTDESVKVMVQSSRDELLEFFAAQLAITQPRDDYRELIELSMLFLGQAPPRGIHFQAPGPMHHARWMSKVLYSLKIWMFRGQFKLTAKEESNLKEICLFCVLIYIKAWITAAMPMAAPKNDLQLLDALLKYENRHPAISKATSEKLANHLWYLSDELVVLALFDSEVTVETKRLMVTAMEHESAEESLRCPRPQMNVRKFGRRGLESFFSPKSMLFFKKLELSTEFLAVDPSTWESRSDYQNSVEKVRALKVVNDFAERGVALVQSYNRLLTKNEDELQFILQVVEEHRRKYPDTLKRTLTAETGQLIHFLMH